MRKERLSPQRYRIPVSLFVACVLFMALPPGGFAQSRQTSAKEDFLTLPGDAGRSGGRLVISLRAEPKTLNPLTAVDAPSREVIGAIEADLVHINRGTQLTEPALACSLIDRVTQTKEYDACVLGLASFDADPNFDLNVWLSSGGTHLWNPSQSHPATVWQAEIDRLMEQQLATPGYEQRKKLYDRVQEILAENQPMIFLASSDILVGAENSIANFHPAVLEPYVPWNVEQLYFRNGTENARR